MKFPSFLRLFGSRSVRKGATASRRAKGQSRLPRPHHPKLDVLEDRTLLSVLPTPTVLDQFRATATGNDSSPVMAINPLDPNKIVIVNVVNTTATASSLAGRFTTNGGISWGNFGLPANFTDPLPNNTTYPLATEPSVAFDRNNRFYVVWAQRRVDDAGGAIAIQRFNFSGATPTQQAWTAQQGGTPTGKKLYEWHDSGAAADRSDPAFNPYIAIDNNVFAFTDQETGRVQSAPRAAIPDPLNPTVQNSQIYVAWNTFNQQPTNNAAFNPCLPSTVNRNVIKMVASSNGGNDFTTQRFVSDNGNCDPVGTPALRYTLPRMVVSQGRSDGRVAGSQLNVAFTSIRPTSQNLNAIQFDRINDGGSGYEFRFTTPTTILDACEPPMGSQTNQPRWTDLTINLNIPDPNFVATDVDVMVGIAHANMEHVRVELLRGPADPRTGCGLTPNGTPLITLLDNRNNADNQQRTGNPTPGITGESLGVLGDLPNGPFRYVGTTFSDQALRRVNDPTGDNTRRMSHFRPELGSLAQFNLTADQINSTPWTLRVWDLVNNGMMQPPQSLRSWSIHFSNGLTSGADSTLVTGNLVLYGATGGDIVNTLAIAKGPWQDATQRGNLPVHPDRGIAPNAVLASDNTLGSFSPYQGRLYMAFTTDAANRHNQSDIRLHGSDDGGQTWFLLRNPINDDAPAIDGFSEGTRTQFAPEIAVDNATGTLVLSWYDGRHDAARSRVARYVATSIDGGLNYGPQTFANVVNSPVDAITRQATNLGPVPDNMSPGNPDRNQAFGFGDRQGLVVNGGRIYLAWSGNLNLPGTSDVMIARMAMPIGPRVVEATMGPVRRTANNNEYQATRLSDGQVLTYNNTFSATGIRQFDGFVITFDRFVDSSTIALTDIVLRYRSPTTPIGVPGEDIPITAITPLFDERLAQEDPNFARHVMAPPAVTPLRRQQEFCLADPGFHCGAKKFLVTFAPQSRTGTYSYSVGPGIRDRIRGSGFVVQGGTPVTYDSTHAPLVVPPVGTGGSGIPAEDIQTATIDVNVPAGQVVNRVQVLIRSLPHTYVSDLVLTVISPSGRRVVLARQQGGGGGPGYTDVTFDDAAGAPISSWVPSLSGTFAPEEPLGAFQTESPTGTWTLEVNDVAINDVGSIDDWALIISTGALQGVFRAGNWMDQNADGVRVEQEGSLLITDAFSNPRPVSGVPFLAPYDNDTLPVIIPGPFLFSHNIPGRPQTLDNLLADAPTSGLELVFDRNMDPNSFALPQVLRVQSGLNPINGPFSFTQVNPRTFRIDFPEQRLSSVYTIQLGAGLRAINGDLMDTNLNAGLSTLRGFDPQGTTVVQTYNSTDNPVSLDAGKTVSMGLTVPNLPEDTFVIQNLTLRINVSYPSNAVDQLEGTLVHPDGTRVLLFDTLRAGIDTQDAFPNTRFDDTVEVPRTTSITLAAAPYLSTYIPQLPLSALRNKLSTGTWRLEIRNKSADVVGQINNFSVFLTKPITGTGLGEEVADTSYAWFRLWSWDGRNELSRTQFQPMGPGSTVDDFGILRGGRIGAIAVDPSDPSGNLVYVAGASGGLWKTNNFLTQDPAGPTYVPLTDFGPTLGINVGSLGITGRNNDPRQSILFLGTGEGDTLNVINNQMGGVGTATSGTTNRGVGIVRSIDGGANWLLLDSSVNFDTQGNPLPINSPLRDHIFAGQSVFKVLVDPRPRPDGEALVYAAISGPNANAAGIWRSEDTGRTWQRMRAGQATDIVFDLNSAVVDAFGRPGNIQVLYAAFRGDGVYTSPDFGTVWNILPGGRGNPLLLDIATGAAVPVGNPAAPISGDAAAPNGANGRILLAKPEPTGNPVQDVLYQGWLYAAVIGPGGNLAGLYQTKDRGFNWTRLRHPNGPNGPSNDGNLGDQANGSTVGSLTGNNYNVSFAVDPNNPNVVYYGGAGVIRVDATGAADAHAFYFAHDRNDGGLRGCPPNNVNQPIVRANNDACNAPRIGAQYAPFTHPFTNFIRNPNNPLGSPTVVLDRADSWANTGQGTKWVPMNGAMQPTPSIGTFNHHRMIPVRDQATGRTRLIFGTDYGIYTGIDAGNGQYMRSIGGVPSVTLAGGNQNIIFGSRNGNLELVQLYAGAVQPSVAAAQINSVVRGMFYGSTQNLGLTASRVNVLDPTAADYGVTRWNPAATGYSQDVAVDQQGFGTLYESLWGVTGSTNFFAVNRTGQTQGLFQTPGDPQWPVRPGVRFALNPIDSSQILISSTAGRVFRTFNQGLNWDVIGNPANLDSTNAQALAYGAPRPGDPFNARNNFIYAGTVGGRIFVTFTGGGGAGNDWLPLSTGLDGSPVMQIVTNPNRGTNEAYAVTLGGVYHMRDSRAAGAAWTPILGNLPQITHQFYQNPNQVGQLPFSLRSIVADWRYVLPDDPNQDLPPTADPTRSHPILYVGGEAGVYRSLDDGRTWTQFPNVALDGAPREGGYLPVVSVTDMEFAAGRVNQSDGFPEMARSGTDMLYVTTFGRSSFGIRLAPMIFPQTVRLSPTLPNDGPGNIGSDRGISTSDRITNVIRPVFEGITQASQTRPGGNRVRVFLFDVSNPANRRLIGTTEADEFGRFSVQVDAGVYAADGSTDGIKQLEFYAEDSADVRGNTTSFSFEIRSGQPPLPAVPDLAAFADSGFENTDNYTNVRTPTFVGTGVPGMAVRIFANGQLAGQGLVTAQGTYSIQISSLADGNYTITARQIDLAGNISGFTAPMQPVLTIDTVAPDAPPFDIERASDTGISDTDHITNVNRPVFSGTGEALSRVSLLLNNALVGTSTVGPTGSFSVQPTSAIGDGSYSVTIQLLDRAGNLGPATAALSPALVVDTVAPRIPSVPQLAPASRTGQGNTTRFSTPTFIGTGEPNIFMQVLVNGTVVGQARVDGSGNYTVTTSALADGTYTVTGRMMDVAGNVSPLTPALQPPLIVDTGVGRPTLRLAANLVLGGAGPNDVITPFTPQVLEGTAEVGTTVTIRDPNSGTVYDTFVQTGAGTAYTRTLNLVDGRYLLVAEVRDTAGNVSTSEVLTLTVSRAALDADRRFVRALYVAALGRTGSLAEWDQWTPALRTPNGRFNVANAIERSQEARTFVVKTWYETYLGRTARNGEEQGLVRFLVQGFSEEQVVATILGSQEYFDRSALVAGFAGTSNSTTFLQSLYLQILKRSPSQAEINGWLAVLPNLTRGGVALIFMGSPEFRNTNVQNFYRDLLQRPTPPTAAEANGWVQSGIDLTSIRVLFKASPEFFFRQTGFLP